MADNVDLWAWRPSGKPCQTKRKWWSFWRKPVRHPWVYYHSHGIRECADCGERQPLWADFGLIRKDPDHE